MQDPDVVVFGKRLQAILVQMLTWIQAIAVDEFRGPASAELPVVFTFWSFLRCATVETLMNLYLMAIPRRVQQILGRSKIDLANLLVVTHPTSWQTSDWGVF